MRNFEEIYTEKTGKLPFYYEGDNGLNGIYTNEYVEWLEQALDREMNKVLEANGYL